MLRFYICAVRVIRQVKKEGAKPNRIKRQFRRKYIALFVNHQNYLDKCFLSVKKLTISRSNIILCTINV